MQAIHVTGSDSFLCQGDFLYGTSPSGEFTVLKTCFTIKTIHNYSELIIIFYHPFSSHMERGHRWDQDLVYCHALYRLYSTLYCKSPIKGAVCFTEADKCTPAEGWSYWSKMAEPISSKNGDSAQDPLLLVALDIFSFYIYFGSPKWWIE